MSADDKRPRASDAPVLHVCRAWTVIFVAAEW
jgi:hypothetical protein